MWAGFYNAFPESVEEKTNAEQWEFSRTTLQLTLQTATLHEQKHLNNILKIKNSKRHSEHYSVGGLPAQNVGPMWPPNGGSLPITSDRLHIECKECRKWDCVLNIC